MSMKPLEALLLAQIAKDMGRAEEELGRNPEVLTALRRVLDSDHLSREEEVLLGQGGERNPGLVVAKRIEQALQAGNVAASGGAGATVPSPRVVIASSDQAQDAVALHEKIAATIEIEEQAGEIEEHPEIEGQGETHALPPVQKGTLDLRSPETGSPEETAAPGEGTVDLPKRKNVPEKEEVGGTLVFVDEKTLGELDPKKLELDLAQVTRSIALPQGRSLGTVSLLAAPETNLLDRKMRGLIQRRSVKKGDLVGETIGGKYRVIREIGRGGFGAVYEAEDLALGNRVAIKVLTTSRKRRVDLENFREEARRLTKLSHPNIVDWKVFDVRKDQTYYFVMEFLDGEELQDVFLREEKLAPDRVGRILLQVLSALRHAHHLSESESILHLDLKPKNVFVLRSGQPDELIKVIDFGIGQVAGVDPDDAGGASGVTGGSVDGAGTSSTGTISIASRSRPHPSTGGRNTGMGTGTRRLLRVCRSCTPEYASPEQSAHVRGDLDLLNLDGRSDLYSLGVMGFLLLTGRFPYDPPANRIDWLGIHCEQPPLTLATMKVPGLSRGLSRFIDQCLKKDREERWPDTEAAFLALSRIVHPPAWKMLVTVTVPLLLLSLVLLFFVLIKDPGTVDLLLKARTTHDASDAEFLRDAALYLGPLRPSARLEVEGLLGPSRKGTLKLVMERDVNAQEVPGFSLAWVNGKEIEIKAKLDADEEGARETRNSVFLHVKDDSGTECFSQPFKLVFLGESSWDVGKFTMDAYDASYSVAALGSRLVDPVNLPLSLFLSGCKEEDIQSVRISREGYEVFETMVPQPGALLDEVVCRVDSLNRLSLSSGLNQVVVEVIDKAGLAKRVSYPLHVVLDPVRFDGRPDLQSAFASGENQFTVYPGQNPVLAVALNREAALSWDLVNRDGESFPRDPEPGPKRVGTSRVHEVDLGLLHGVRPGKDFSAEIRIEVEDGASVLHADESRGRVRSSIFVNYRVDQPRYKRHLVQPDDPVFHGVSDRPFYTNKTGWMASVNRENPIPLSVTGSYRRLDSETSFPLPEEILEDSSTASFPLAMPQDGVYEVDLQVYQYDPVGRRRFESVLDGQSRFLVVLDSSPATLFLTVDGIPEDRVIRGIDEKPSFLIRVEDQENAGLDVFTPISLTYELTRNEVRVGSGKVLDEGQVPLGAEREYTWIGLPTPWTTNEVAGDGSYELSISGVDAAGNSILEKTFSFTVALTPPSLNLLAPDPRFVWEHDSSLPGRQKMWKLRVSSEDGNGTRGVSVSVRGDAGRLADRIELVRSGEPIGEKSQWEGYIRFPQEWSTQNVFLLLHGVDSAGIEATKSSVPIPLPSIVLEQAACVTTRLKENPEAATGSMRLVRSNRVEYPFGGQSDDLEQARFKESMPYPFRSSSWTRAWGLRYAAGGVPDFYLDEHEVSVGEFLSFVVADNGYLDPMFWPHESFGDAPDRSNRRAELADSLLGVEADLPITNVTWEEAFAFARWAGKRLPSIVEWEYAVRGENLRVFSSFSGDRMNRDQLAGLNTSTGGPWSRNQGADVTPDTRIWNLCSNVAEWTATPEFLIRGISPFDDRDRRTEARRNPQEFLDPRLSRPEREWESLHRYFVAGGDFMPEQNRFDFFVQDVRRRNTRSFAVGFRCALDAVDVREALSTGQALSSRVLVEEVPE